MFPADNVDTIISEPEVEKHPIISIQIESKDQLTNQHLNDLERDINELQQESTDKVEDEQSMMKMKLWRESEDRGISRSISLERPIGRSTKRRSRYQNGTRENRMPVRGIMFRRESFSSCLISIKRWIRTLSSLSPSIKNR